MSQEIQKNVKETTFRTTEGVTEETICQMIEQAWRKRNPQHCESLNIEPTSYVHYDMPTEYLVTYAWRENPQRIRYHRFTSFEALWFIADYCRNSWSVSR